MKKNLKNFFNKENFLVKKMVKVKKKIFNSDLKYDFVY